MYYAWAATYLVQELNVGTVSENYRMCSAVLDILSIERVNIIHLTILQHGYSIIMILLI